jgi:ubiquinone/menaquinone biosynthesis C-methylase UbiE
VGIDPSTLLLDRARREIQYLAQARGEQLPFPTAGFDAVIAECCLSLMDDPRTAIRELARLLPAGGRLIVNDLYARRAAGVRLLRRLSIGCCLKGAMSQETLIDLFDSCGFCVDLWEDHTQDLKNLAAQLVFAHGSMQNFWYSIMPGDERAQQPEIQRAVSESRPGYFLLLATKTSNRI